LTEAGLPNPAPQQPVWSRAVLTRWLGWSDWFGRLGGQAHRQRRHPPQVAPSLKKVGRHDILVSKQAGGRE
jgi:hypothetical protein